MDNIGRATISVHCHDDLGMAVANSLAGIENGARQIEGTINGIGERAGNASLEEVVMALHTRQDYYKVGTGINTRELYRSSRMVADALGVAVPANKAVVGKNAFSHSSGIHVDGFLKDRQTYEIMRPEDVGFPASRVVLTARTGRQGVFHRLAELGMELSAEEKEKVFSRFLRLADKKQEVHDQDLIALVQDEVSLHPGAYGLEYCQIHCESGQAPQARIRLTYGNAILEGQAHGDGPVDAAYKAISRAVGANPAVVRYEIQAVTGGTDALGKVMVHMEQDGRKVLGKGASTDVIEASVKAYLDGLNRLAAVIEGQSGAGEPG
ncbi:MAG TPA: alpha-isopropylmalate synthase regulatory domain-containing protein [Pseudodesulfovibrio sp.]|nr:alpha-isopropylmalate synthase regulatory domain-containing protein [Pseudodesulfovibrio sp.]